MILIYFYGDAKINSIVIHLFVVEKSLNNLSSENAFISKRNDLLPDYLNKLVQLQKTIL